MKTSKPFSTISYNTPDFFKSKSEDLVSAAVMTFVCWIDHVPEDDELKAHTHAYFEPSKMVQTDDVRLEYTELDKKNPDKPRKCMPCRSSKFADWYLYAIHDQDYLLSKGETRKHHYTDADIKSTDPDYLQELIRTVHHEDSPAIVKIKNAISAGTDFAHFLARGSVPPSQIAGFYQLWDAVSAVMREESATRRGTHQNHENPAETEFDPSTGEVIERSDNT